MHFEGDALSMSFGVFESMNQTFLVKMFTFNY